MQSCNRKQYATSNVVLPGIRRVIGSLTLNSVTTPTIANIPIPVANTEVSYALPAGSQRFELRVRNVAVLKLSFAAGQSGVTYVSVSAGSCYMEEGIDPAASITLHFQTAVAGSLVEIVSWA